MPVKPTVSIPLVLGLSTTYYYSARSQLSSSQFDRYKLHGLLESTQVPKQNKTGLPTAEVFCQRWHGATPATRFASFSLQQFAQTSTKTDSAKWQCRASQESQTSASPEKVCKRNRTSYQGKPHKCAQTVHESERTSAQKLCEGASM